MEVIMIPIVKVKRVLGLCCCCCSAIAIVSYTSVYPWLKKNAYVGYLFYRFQLFHSSVENASAEKY